MRRWLRRRFWFGATLLLILLVRGAAAGQERQTVVVGSKAFTESRILGEVIAQLIETRTDLRVHRRLNIGGTTLVFSAMRDGEVDIYPEYTGTGWTVQLEQAETGMDSLEAFLRVRHRFRERFGIEWMQPFGFSNSYALAMRESIAAERNINNISDLRAHQSNLRAGVSHEFLNRSDGYPGLAEAYDLELGQVRGMEHGLAYDALQNGRVDIIDTYTTDGKLLRYPVRVLDDDRGFFPPYECAPIVRQEALRRYPELRTVLDELAFSIDEEEMRRMNLQVEEGGRSYETVARNFLQRQGVLRATASDLTDAHEGGLLRVLWSRRAQTAELTLQHLGLTMVAVLLATLFAVPLGLALSRAPRFASLAIGVTGVIQTIPSLALLAFMIPLPGLGLGARSAVTALFLYALLPIVRNTYTGIREVDADLLEAARGIGMKESEILWRVEVPLAATMIMAGIRTSTVISVGVATLAAFIGAGGLGDPIVTGLQLNDIDLILSGAIPAALLAVSADFILGRAERLVAPKGVS